MAATQKQWTVTGTGKDLEHFKLLEGPVPRVGEYEVLVRMEAASLNYRDLIIPRGLYPFPLAPPVVAGSDGAGEVVEVGPKVTAWRKGDRVATLFNQNHQYGPMHRGAYHSGLGGAVDGVLRPLAVLPETGLVRCPANLSPLEASTLPCAALTAWNALYGLKPLKPGQTVLVQGTGGVSIFALQFAKAAGAKVIATTSSAEKAERLRQLGADHVINYREDPAWGETARALTRDGAGADHVIEVGGESTAAQSLKAIRFEGVISVIGFLGGVNVGSSMLETLTTICTARGVYVGSREQMEDMVAAIEANDIRPVVDDRVFGFEEADEAYKYMWDQRHFGKLTIKFP